MFHCLPGPIVPLFPSEWVFHYELELLAQAGVPNDAVLQMATRKGAAFLGALDRIGTLEIGKVADIVAVEGDPRTDIRVTRNIKAVWQNGRRVNLDVIKECGERFRSRASADYSPECPPFGIPNK